MGCASEESGFISWYFYSSLQCLIHLCGQPNLPYNTYYRLCLWVLEGKPTGHEADHAPLSTAEFKDAWSCTSFTPYGFMACTWANASLECTWCPESYITELHESSRETLVYLRIQIEYRHTHTHTNDTIADRNKN
jgi:hypothetical protein